MLCAHAPEARMSDNEQFYWCMDHARVETHADRCKADNRMGPYPTRQAAQNWREKVEDRNDAWADEDERWEGSPAE